MRIFSNFSFKITFDFYRCGHCKRLKPEYAKAAELLRGNDPPITLAKVDCTEAGKDTCNKYSVSGYPTLKIFSGDEMVNDYNGPREAPGIAKYMRVRIHFYYILKLNCKIIF